MSGCLLVGDVILQLPNKAGGQHNSLPLGGGWLRRHKDLPYLEDTILRSGTETSGLQELVI